MSRSPDPSPSIPPFSVVLLVILCLLWGANMVSIKLINRDIPPICTAAIRSVVSSLLLWIYAWFRNERVWLDRKDLKPGILIGALFGIEFLFLYWGLSFTDASRAVIILYTHPFWVALGAHFFLTGDRITAMKSLGLVVAFVGVALVFGSRSTTPGAASLAGDSMELAAAMLWAATTLCIKKYVMVRPISYYQTMFAQLFFSIPVLFGGYVLLEAGTPVTFSPLVLGVLFYQSVIVAFMSYLVWFWMIHRYAVSRLAAFTFLTPLGAVIMSGLILKEQLTPAIWGGLALVAAGIYLVNYTGRLRI